ncbi:MAG: hypothetical protein GY928_13920 [Colwellia sp.]|nr:hypothetical protein [Colwellia sp.]
MNKDTGKIRYFSNEEVIPKNWVHWPIHEIVEIKGCMFKTVRIDPHENTITFKGINKKAKKSLERS